MDCSGCDDCAFNGEGETPADLHEIHITVQVPEGLDVSAFVAACEAIDVKPIVVAYSNRDDPSEDQPIGSILDPMTSQKFRGDEAAALAEAKRISEYLNFEGFYPIRCKIETTPANPIVNQGKGYFESHIGCVLPKARLESLRTAARSLNAHVSANAFKDHGDTVTMMITYRQNADATTPDQFTKHMTWMRGMFDSIEGIDTDRLIVEYCWYDSNKQHDNTWMGEQ